MPEPQIDLAGLGVGAEQFLVALLETTRQPLCVIDHAGVIRFANPAAVGALGYEDAGELTRNLRSLLTGETVASELDWFIRRDGSRFPVSYVSVPLELPEGRGAVVTFTDIEDRLRAEALRRVATLVARAVPPPDLFTAVTREMDLVLGGDSAHDKEGVATLVAAWSRDAAFTELLDTAISNSEAQRERGRLADEQAALRRVATLVAEGVPATELFGAVTKEVGQLLRVDAAAMIRYGRDVMTAVGNWTAEGVEADTEVGRQWPFEGDSLAPRILETGRSARIDDWRDVPGAVGDYVRAELGLSSSVGSPILLGGKVWGNLVVHSTGGPLPGDTEERLERFTALVATAVSNSEARAEVGRLAEEQAALRRVATLVARESPPEKVFAAVAEEVGRLLQIEDTRMVRYESDGSATVVASWGRLVSELPVGTRLTLDGESATALVRRTGRPARIDDFTSASGDFAATLRRLGVHSAVAAPIIVEGRLWGAMNTASLQIEPLPLDTEARMRQFTELAATAISNVESRLDLAASRLRIVRATDAARRRFERDLHDGAQQRLVSLVLDLQGAEALTPQGEEHLRSRLLHVGDGLTGVLEDLRELSRGLHPAILTQGGLKTALGALARRSAIPIDLQVSIDDGLDEGIEVAAYYVVSEALANTTKHADASMAGVTVQARDGILDLRIHDDGVGGADPAHGSGLVGLSDRVEALGGTISIVSPAGAGTSVHVELPVASRAPRA